MRILLIIFTLISFSGLSQTIDGMFIGDVDGMVSGSTLDGMSIVSSVTAPYYVSNGGIAAGGDVGVTMDMPTGVQADDLIFLLMMDADDDSFTTPLGYTKLKEYTTVRSLSTALFYKKSSGTEPSTVTVNSASNGGSLVAGVICIYREADPTLQYEFVDQEFPNSLPGYTYLSPPASPLAQYTGTKLMFGVIEDNCTYTITGSGWDALDFQVTTTFGSDCTLGVFSKGYTAGQSFSGTDNFSWTEGTTEYTNAMFIALPEVQE